MKNGLPTKFLNSWDEVLKQPLFLNGSARWMILASQKKRRVPKRAKEPPAAQAENTIKG
jgi:hypothetical protein